MACNYYYLVAGLREYSIDADAKGFDAVAIREEIYEELNAKDKEHLRELYRFFDISNIIALLGGKDNFSPLGNFTREELEEEIAKPSRLPKYIGDVLVTYRNKVKEDKYAEIDETIDTSVPIERVLWTRYYDECAKSDCRFINSWYGFDMELRNISTAYTARKLGREIAPELMGQADMLTSLSRSSAIDFGLKSEVDYTDRLIQILDEKNMLDKERRFDILRWDKSDEFSDFDYFNINKVLSYCVKLNIIHRWLALDKATGTKMFEALIEGLTARQILEKTVDVQGVPAAVNTVIE